MISRDKILIYILENNTKNKIKKDNIKKKTKNSKR